MNTSDEWEKEVEELNRDEYRIALDKLLDKAEKEYAASQMVSRLYSDMERIMGDSYEDMSRGK